MSSSDDYYDPDLERDRPMKRPRRAAAVRASVAVANSDLADQPQSDDEYHQQPDDEHDPQASTSLHVTLGGPSRSSRTASQAGPESDYDSDISDEDVKPKRSQLSKVNKKVAASSQAGGGSAGGIAPVRLQLGGGGGAGKGKAKASGEELVAAVFDQDHDFTKLELKPDHQTRPFYISPNNGNVILEAFHPLAARATDFLIAIAEPVSRPKLIHEYKLTTHSLYAAVSVGLQTEDIIETLNRMSKVPVPKTIADFIRDCTMSYGKVKLVLKQNKHYVESSHPETLRLLLRDEIVSKARVIQTEDEAQSASQAGAAAEFGLEKHKAPTRNGLVIAGTNNKDPAAAEAGADPAQAPAVVDEDDILGDIIGRLEREDALDDDEEVHAFEIKESEIEAVKKRCLELDYPMMEEYDFRNDERNPTLEIDLKPTSSLRPYQSKSLAKMLGNGRARSGIIVLPCGAGKTLVGVAAACTIRKSSIVLCTSGVSVMQWKQQFLQWSTIQDPSIAVFTADQKEKFITDAGIVVSTYSMVANRQKRSHDSQKMMDFLSSREWGFVLLDEVHVVPAAMFRQVVTKIKAHSKLGLTATLVREDDKIDDLNFLIGPKLYEANWMDLAANGHIATVQCAEVWCDMTPEFYREYLREKSRKKMLLYSMNPKKFQSCQFLIKYHEGRGDKIIVFSDNVYALEAYAKKLGKLYIHGGTPQVERMRILQNFQHNPLVNTIFLSKVGDTSIDLPEATCLIQISSHFGSRRQEAQRLGRILRAKRRNDEGFNAFFYSLVSKDTQEIYYSTKRQGFLVDQGYAFKVITALDGMENMPGLVYASRAEQIELLQSVLLANESDADIGTDVRPGDEDRPTGRPAASRGGPAAQATRTAGSLVALSGGQSMAYIERNKSQNKQLAKEGKRHALFRKKDEKRKAGTKK